MQEKNRIFMSREEREREERHRYTRTLPAEKPIDNKEKKDEPNDQGDMIKLEDFPPPCSVPGCENPCQWTGTFKKDKKPLWSKTCRKHLIKIKKILEKNYDA